MAATAAPYGLQPISDQTGLIRPLRIPNGIHSTLSSNIFKYQPVKIDTTYGTITPITATTDKIFGVFSGVEYTPTGGRPIVSPFWPANGTWDSTYDMFAYVWPAWTAGSRWQIQADGSVAQALLGSQFNVSNFAAGSTVTGSSQCTAAAAGVAGASQGQLFLMEFANNVGDAVGDAFTDLIVGIANPQVGYGPQTSIG